MNGSFMSNIWHGPEPWYDPNTRLFYRDVAMSTVGGLYTHVPVCTTGAIPMFIDAPVEVGEPTIFCDYCHGSTKNDSRGNCCACGAPRSK